MLPQVLDNSLADVSFLVGLMVDKFQYHLPLYRQHQRLQQSGITLARATLTKLVKRSIALLKPIVAAQLQHVLQSKVLAEVAYVLDAIGTLYKIEDAITEKSLRDDKKRQYRLKHSKPIVDHLFEWAEQQLNGSALTPKHPLTQAINYTLRRQQALSVFLEDPDVPLDTNHVERALRTIPMGRKNWLFCWTELGAEQLGIIQSLITT